MADFHWTAIDNGTAGTRVGTQANPFRGWKEVCDKIANGTINGGDNVFRVPGSGPVNLADRAQFPSNGTAVTSGISVGTGTSIGPMAGSSSVASSTASGIKFFMQSTLADPAFDMRGVTSNGQRMLAAMRFIGEDIELHDICGYCSDWNYIRDGSGNTRIAGTSASTFAEDRSSENTGVMIIGNGNKVFGAKIDGGNRHARCCLYMGVKTQVVSGASSNKKNQIIGYELFGANQGLDCQPDGGGANELAWTFKSGQGLLVRGISGIYNGKIHTACWGREGSMSVQGYNTSFHGNAARIVGKYHGGARIEDFDISGEWQDGLVLAGGTELVGTDGFIHDVGADTSQMWVWNTGTARWELTTLGVNTQGMGVKCGLGSYDGESPTAWLGQSGGAAGGNLNVKEVRTILQRLKIYRTKSFGISSNGSQGTFINACEIDDTGNSCVVFATDSSNGTDGNYWIQNSFLRKFDTDPSNNVLHVTANARVCGCFNNIFWSNPNISTQRDVTFVAGALAVPAGAWDKNLLVTGRTSGSVPTNGNLTPQTPAWTQGVGLSAGSPLRGAGTTASFSKGRTSGMTRNLNKARFTSPPNLGPY